jgi:hypothetical protein
MSTKLVNTSGGGSIPPPRTHNGAPILLLSGSLTTADDAYYAARLPLSGCQQLCNSRQSVLLCQLPPVQLYLSCSVLSSCAVAWVASLPHPPPRCQRSRHPLRCLLLMTQHCQWCRHLALLLNGYPQQTAVESSLKPSIAVNQRSQPTVVASCLKNPQQTHLNMRVLHYVALSLQSACPAILFIAHCHAAHYLRRSSRQLQPEAGTPAYAASNQTSGKPQSSSGSRRQHMPCRQLRPHSPHPTCHSWDCCR